MILLSHITRDAGISLFVLSFKQYDMEYFVPFEVALSLKKLGFKDGCPALYRLSNREFIQNDSIDDDMFKSYNDAPNTAFLDAPTYPHAIKWLEVNKGYILKIKEGNDGQFYSEIFKIKKDFGFNLYKPVLMSDEIGASLDGIESILEYLGAPVFLTDEERIRTTLESHAVDLDV